jgi:hypothetical protein
MGMYGGGVPAADPNIGIAQNKLAELAERNQAYYNENFAPVILDQMRRQVDISGRQADLQEEGQRYEMGRAKQYDSRYFDTQVPLEDQIIAKARQYNEADQQEQYAGRAGADVTQAFAQSRDGLQRTMARRGVGLGSGAGLSAMSRMGTEEALAKAGAMNQTREAARQLGWTRLGEAAALGRGLPGFGQASAGLSSGMGQQALSAGGAGLSAAAGASGAYSANVGASGDLWNSVGGLGVNKYSADISAYNSQQANNPMNSVLGAAAGVGMSWGLKRFLPDEGSGR